MIASGPKRSVIVSTARLAGCHCSSIAAAPGDPSVAKSGNSELGDETSADSFCAWTPSNLMPPETSMARNNGSSTATIDGPVESGTSGVTDLVTESNEANLTFSNKVPAETPAALVRRATASQSRTR